MLNYAPEGKWIRVLKTVVGITGFVLLSTVEIGSNLKLITSQTEENLPSTG